MACIECGRGFHEECRTNCENCHSISDEEMDRLTNSIRVVGYGVGAPIKPNELVRDVKSTGRKRAAVHFPINRGDPCEWQGLKNCGGGLNPIVGCIDGKQADRHHGPDKDTLENRVGNVHRICKKCHNRWHALNDPTYDSEIYKTLLHNPEPADIIELSANEAYWRTKR